MSALINWKKVIELRDDLGADEFAEVVELFLEDVGERISQLGGAGRSVNGGRRAGMEDLADQGAGQRIQVSLVEVSCSCQIRSSRNRHLAEASGMIRGRSGAERGTCSVQSSR